MMSATRLRGLILPLLVLGCACLVPVSRAWSLPGTATQDEPDWYKISIDAGATLQLQVNATGVSGSTTLGVAITLGIAANFGDTMALRAVPINSSANASITYQHVDTTPLYLVVFFVTNETGLDIPYNITSSHPVVVYSYAEYYAEVVHPDLMRKLVLLATALSGIAIFVTVYFLQRRQREKALAPR